MAFADVHGSPVEYRKRIDKMLVYVGRYGRQNAVDLSDRLSVVDLENWMGLLVEMLEKENTAK